MLVRRVPRADARRGAVHPGRRASPRPRPRRPAVTTPKQFFGFNIGDDYQLATYDQFVQMYWQKIDKESNRMQVIEIGKTEEGRPHLAAIITAPGELRQARSLQADLAAAAPRARHHRRAGARARQGRQGGGLDRRRPARDRSRRRASADRDGLSARQPHRRGDDADPARRDRHRGARRIPTACRWSRSATCRTPDPLQRRTCSPRLYNEVRGPRQQPRLLHVEH